MVVLTVQMFVLMILLMFLNQTYREEQARAAEKTRRLETDGPPFDGSGLTVKIPSAPSSPEKKTTKDASPKTPTTTTQEGAFGGGGGHQAEASSSSSPSTASSASATAAAAVASTTFLKLHEQTECVICLETVPDVIFLPCGHVCGCQNCAEPLKECPLCRQEIAFKLAVGAATRAAA